MTSFRSGTNVSTKHKSKSESGSKASSPQSLNYQVQKQHASLTKYARRRPARVFVPALRQLQGEEKKVIAGTRRPAPKPWQISSFYQEFSPYGVLIRQQEEY